MRIIATLHSFPFSHLFLLVLRGLRLADNLYLRFVAALLQKLTLIFHRFLFYTEYVSAFVLVGRPTSPHT